MRQRSEWDIFAFVRLVDPHGVALAERAAACILTGQAHAVTFCDQTAESECFCGGPVEAFAALEHLSLGFEHTAERLVDRKIVGNCGQRAAEAVEQFAFDSGFDIAAGSFGISWLMQPAPTSAEPVCFAGFIFFGSCELVFQQVDKILLHGLRVACRDHAVFHQLAPNRSR